MRIRKTTRQLAGLAAAGVFGALVSLVVLVAGSARPAHAHASLLEVSPANGEVVDDGPDEVVLVFNEPVSLVGGSVRVLDDDARQVSGEPVAAGETVTVPLDAVLADGTYTVTFVVVSTDSHRIGGATVFHVGEASSEGLVDLADVGDDAGWGLRAGTVGLTAVGYAGGLIAGGVSVLAVASGGWRRWEPADAGSDRGSRDLARRWSTAIIRAAVLGAVATIAATPLRIARLGGGLDALRDNDVIREYLRGPVGQSTAVVAIGLLAVAVAVDRRAKGWVLISLSVGALAGFALEGHTRSRREALMIGADVVHLAAGAVWFGGLVALVVAFRTSTSTDRLGLIVRRFSMSAVCAVVVAGAAGVTMAWVVAPDVGALTTTGWGLALVVKVALVVVVVAAGLYNNRVLVAGVAGSADDPPDRSRDPGARRRLARIVTGEALVLLAVVGVTAVLVTRSPIASPGAPVAGAPALGADGAPEEQPEITVRVDMSDGGSAEVALSPGTTGSNEVDVILRDVEGRVVNPIEPPVLSLTQPELGIGPLQPEMSPRYIGHYTAGAELSFAGEWEVAVRVRLSDFESVSGTVTIELDE